VLEERRVPVKRLGAFASRPRANAVRFEQQLRDVEVASAANLAEFDVVFFASGEDASEKFVPALIERGIYVIDNSSTYRMGDAVPLIIPEVNGESVLSANRLFPVANCTAIIMCMALAPIRNVAGLKSVRAATYQAASGAGRAGLDELLAGERAVVEGAPEVEATVFPHRLARNVVPQVGTFDETGYCGEEIKVADEMRKMLGLPELFVSATTVRVPVRTAHSAAIYLETERPTTVAELSEALSHASGVVFHPGGIVTPRDVEGSDTVHVARLRAEETGTGRHFAVWCVGDQLRKGAATNGVQILELLVRKGFVSA
jgi:aspartate-semialdehyde dehydrogenase